MSEVMDPNLRYTCKFTVTIFPWCNSITSYRESITNNKVIIIEDNGSIFGSGFLLCGLSNNFASDDTNIFNKDYLEQLVILNNVWD